MNFVIYLLVTAGVTYLVRLIPMIVLKEKIRSRFLLSFLHYIPYAVLSVMTVPAIFTATDSPWSAGAGFLAAIVMAWRGHSLVQVAAVACAAVLAVQLLL